MKRSALWIALTLAAVATLVYFSISSGPSPEAYAKEIEEDREQKIDFLKTDKESRLYDKRDAFVPPTYFPPDLKFRISARLEPIQQKLVRQLITSTFEYQRYLDYAWAVFELDGKEQRLLILEVMEMGPNRGKLFLAFADETSARETYGGGRYLDLKKVRAATTIELDFNKAYNPYCAYNHNFSCPLPPQENLLKVAIRAGEKKYE